MATQRIELRVRKEIAEALDQLAKQSEQTRAKLINKVLEDYTRGLPVNQTWEVLPQSAALEPAPPAAPPPAPEPAQEPTEIGTALWDQTTVWDLGQLSEVFGFDLDEVLAEIDEDEDYTRKAGTVYGTSLAVRTCLAVKWRGDDQANSDAFSVWFDKHIG